MNPEGYWYNFDISVFWEKYLPLKDDATIDETKDQANNEIIPDKSTNYVKGHIDNTMPMKCRLETV